MGYTCAWVEPSLCAKFPSYFPVKYSPPASTRITRQKCNLMGYTRAWIMPLMCAKASNRCRGLCSRRRWWTDPGGRSLRLRRASHSFGGQAGGDTSALLGRSVGTRARPQGLDDAKGGHERDSKPPLAHARGYGKNFKVDAVGLTRPSRCRGNAGSASRRRARAGGRGCRSPPPVRR